jgi:hypothetical protein
VHEVHVRKESLVKVRLEDKDRILVRWVPVKDELCPTPIDVVIVGVANECWSEDEFSVLWQNPVDDGVEWEQAWRGPWRTVMKKFSDLVEGLDAEQTQDRLEAERARQHETAGA